MVRGGKIVTGNHCFPTTNGYKWCFPVIFPLNQSKDLCAKRCYATCMVHWFDYHKLVDWYCGKKKQVPDWNPGASLLQVCIAVCHYCWLLSNGIRLSSCPIVLVRCCCLHKKRINGRLHDMAMLDRLLQSSVPLQRLASNPVELKQCADNWVRHRLEMPNFDICHVFPKTLPLQLYFCVLDIRWRSSQIVGKSYGHRRTLQFRVVGRWTVIIIRITERERVFVAMIPSH